MCAGLRFKERRRKEREQDSGSSLQKREAGDYAAVLPVMLAWLTTELPSNVCMAQGGIGSYLLVSHLQIGK